MERPKDINTFPTITQCCQSQGQNQWLVHLMAYKETRVGRTQVTRPQRDALLPFPLPPMF